MRLATEAISHPGKFGRTICYLRCEAMQIPSWLTGCEKLAVLQPADLAQGLTHSEDALNRIRESMRTSDNRSDIHIWQQGAFSCTPIQTACPHIAAHRYLPIKCAAEVKLPLVPRVNVCRLVHFVRYLAIDHLPLPWRTSYLLGNRKAVSTWCPYNWGERPHDHDREGTYTNTCLKRRHNRARWEGARGYAMPA